MDARKPPPGLVAAHFSSHLVPIFIELESDTAESSVLFTAFILSVNGQWFLMTAGHCINEIEAARKKGFEIVQARLLDGIGPNATFNNAVPFNWDDARPYADPEGEHDYGVLVVLPHVRRLLEKNNVVAFTEESWKHNIFDFDLYQLVGLPAQWQERVGPQNINVTTLIALLDKTDRGDFPETEVPTFYGRLKGDPVASLKGTSGGPILGFRKNAAGDWKYFLVAMQSTTQGGNRNIKGMLIPPLALLLDEIGREQAPRGPHL